MPVYVLTAQDDKQPERIVIDALNPAEAEGHAVAEKIGGESRVWKTSLLPIDRSKLPPASARSPFVICVGGKSCEQTVSASESTASEGDDVPEAELAGTDADESPDINPDDFSESMY